MFDNKTLALIALAVVLVFMVCLLIRYVKAGQKSRVWVTAATTVFILVVWVIHFIQNFR